MPNFVIRKLSPDDADAFRTLRLEGLRVAPSAFGRSFDSYLKVTPAEVRLQIESDPGFIVGAFDDHNQLAGVIGVTFDPMQEKRRHRAMVRGVYVDLRARGYRLGYRMLEQAISWAQDLSGVEALNLTVNAENQHAIAVYEALGFRVWGKEPRAIFFDGTYYDELHMQRTI